MAVGGGGGGGKNIIFYFLQNIKKYGQDMKEKYINLGGQ